MKLIFILLFTYGCSTVFGQQTVINDKNAEVRTVTDFSGIQVLGAIEVYLSQADGYALAVSGATAEYRDNIITKVRNGILVISYKSDRFHLNGGDKRLRAYISFKTIESIQASGASAVIITGALNGGSMLIKLSGASEIKGHAILNDVNINLSGASTAKITGSAQNLNLTASGASDLKSYDFVVQNCVANLSGASDVSITINNSVSCSATGASMLQYEGSPERKEVATSGASAVSHINN
jgi:hypothetical protein